MFIGKLENYNRFRPNYPKGLIDHLEKKGILKKQSIIAEMGCGTGKLTSLLLDNGNTVYGVEPNPEMYKHLINTYSSFDKFLALNASAECSKIKSNTCDLVVCAQSFHLFNSIKAKNEFERILKSNGSILLIWYFESTNCSILNDIRNMFYFYRNKLNQQTRTKISLDNLQKIFSSHSINHEVYGKIHQNLSKRDFVNSMLSSSYAPIPQNELYNSYIECANKIFDRYNQKGLINYFFEINIFTITSYNQK